jgi:lipopolysaccharide transport system permease protein
MMNEYTIEPVRSRIHIRNLVAQAPIIRVISMRDLKARYKQSLLGPLWIVFQPMALLAGYLVGFRSVTHVPHGAVPYAIFALGGIAIWAYFQAAATAGTSSIISNNSLVRSTTCPRIVFPIASLLACLPSLLIPFLAAAVAVVILGDVSVRWLLLPVIAVWAIFVTSGFVAITAGVTVRFRDMIQGLPFLLQVGAFVVPVGYPVSFLPEKLRVVVSLNPLTGVIEAWRWALLDTAHPYMLAIYLSLVIGTVFTFAGWWLFGRVEVKMSDIL